MNKILTDSKKLIMLAMVARDKKITNENKKLQQRRK